MVRKSVVKNEEHSEFEEPVDDALDAADIADEVEQDEDGWYDDVGEDEPDDSIEY